MPGTILTGANPYQGIQYGGYEVRDLRGNGVLSFFGSNALIAYNPQIATSPVNRATLTVYRPEIQILDPLSVYLACVIVDKSKFLRLVKAKFADAHASNEADSGPSRMLRASPRQRPELLYRSGYLAFHSDFEEDLGPAVVQYGRELQ